MKYNQPYGVSDVNAPYINGNPSTGTMGSIPPAASIEYPQREIVNLIADAGLQLPDNADLHQLAKAVQSFWMNARDDVGTVNSLQVTLSPAPTAYYKYMLVICKIAQTNTAPAVLNVNALGAKSITHIDGTPLGNAELLQGAIAGFMYDGTHFQWVLTGGGGAGGGGGSPPGPGPIYITAPKTLYVDGNIGSDTSYDGSQPTVAAPKGPFQTIQHALDVMKGYNNNGFDFTIKCADFSAGYGHCTGTRVNGSGTVHIVGNITNPAACVWAGLACSAVAGQYWVRGFKLVNPSGGAISGDQSGTTMWMSNLEFGACYSPGHIVMQRGASGLYAGVPQGVASPSLKISGGVTGPQGQYHVLVLDGGSFAIYAQPLTIVGTPDFGSTGYGAFWGAEKLAVIDAGGGYSIISGGCTGQKFVVTQNSVIDTGGAGVNYLPGSLPGSTSYGGVYT